MAKIRINDLAQEMGIESSTVLRTLPLVGLAGKESHSGMLNKQQARTVRAYIRAHPGQFFVSSLTRSRAERGRTPRNLAPLAKFDGPLGTATVQESVPAQPAPQDAMKTAAAGSQGGIRTPSKSDHIPPRLPGVPVERFSFKLLPPGTWNIDDVIAHYRGEAKRNPSEWWAQEFQEWRLVVMKSLGPSKCYVGEEQWNGYVVFEFARSPRVALECPRKGNTTYILWDDWKSMVVHSKGYIRDHFPNKYERVFHTDRAKWHRKVKRALKLR